MHCILYYSIIGSITHAGYGAYAATKHALEGLFQALHEEIEPFGLSTLLLKPGAFRTDILKPTGDMTITKNTGIYNEYQVKGKHTEIHNIQLGDPYRAAIALDEVLHTKPIPLELLLGSDSYDAVIEKSIKQLNEYKKYEKLSKSTDFPKEEMEEGKK